jgi:hypothetical protein
LLRQFTDYHKNKKGCNLTVKTEKHNSRMKNKIKVDPATAIRKCKEIVVIKVITHFKNNISGPKE